MRQEAIRAAQAKRRRRNQGIVIAVVVAMIGLIAYGVSQSGGKKTNVSTNSSTSSTPTTAKKQGAVDPTCPKADGSSPRETNFKKAPGMCIDPAKTYTATMVTSKGTMEIALDAKAAPKTVNNFVFLARYHFYDGLTFHRVVPNFVIQGGDPKGNGSGGPGYQFADELPSAGQYKVGSLAMANSGADTNGSQFFVITGSQGVSLPPKYSLFGQVTTGIDVAHAIEALGTGDGPPSQTVTIQSVTIKEA
jgi:cyclophilin family peptidyl-prolyl cis-trans isomerase